jgi:hypothetical protein
MTALDERSGNRWRYMLEKASAIAVLELLEKISVPTAR